MKVYRLCREEEVKRILLDHSFCNIGNFCKNNGINSHNYKKNIRYLHFFKSRTDLLYLNTLKGRYICVYDIPTDILTRYYGKGKYASYFDVFYSDKKSISNNLEDVEEYAIPSNLITLVHLKVIAKIIETIEIEDFYDDYYLSKCIEIIYNNKIINETENQSAISNYNKTLKNEIHLLNNQIDNLSETNSLEK